MNLDFTAEEAAFREEAREWLRVNVPTEPRPVDGDEMAEFDRRWLRKQYEGGWAGISWPAAYGGRELPVINQLIWFEECALADAPYIGAGFVGFNHGGPTLIARGSEAQKSKYLPPI